MALFPRCARVRCEVDAANAEFKAQRRVRDARMDLQTVLGSAQMFRTRITRSTLKARDAVFREDAPAREAAHDTDVVRELVAEIAAGYQLFMEVAADVAADVDALNLFPEL